MKLKLSLFLVLLFFYQSGFSQEIPNGAVMIDQNTLIKDENGNKVELNNFTELMNSGEWTMDPVKDNRGNLSYIQLKKATDEDRKELSFKNTFDGIGADRIGKTAPDFEMTDLKGNSISSKNAFGKVIVLNFWFAACKPCIAEIPELNEVYKKYNKDTNVVFASITFESKETVKAFLKKHKIKYPIVVSAAQLIDSLKIFSYPTNIVIDKNGKYSYFMSGGFPNIGEQIDISIQNALNNKDSELQAEPTNSIKPGPNSIFKLMNGEIVPFDKAFELLNSTKYDIIPHNESGSEYYLLKEKD